MICEEQLLQLQEGITIKWSIVSDLRVEADLSLMTRLIMNLINNAIQYGKENGQIKVTLTTSEDTYIRLTVKDDGIGIAQEEQDKIWQRFYQVNKARTSNDNGSMGIGLAMVAWITEYHKGKIGVESEIGKGSSFIFEMPLEKF